MKKIILQSFLFLIILIGGSSTLMGQTTITIGNGSSSSSTRGPFQRADTNSTTVFSRWHQIYTASELATAGLTSGASISELKWELASSNVIIGSGDANLKIYIKNSSATAATSDTWTNLTTGSTLVLDNDYNTTNNFPGANGWMPFTFSSAFTYTGGALEISVDWDCSQVSTPAFSGNGAIKWRWESTAPDDLVVKKTSSSAPSTTLTDLKDERANIQIVFNSLSCAGPTGLNASNITMNSADLGWTAAPSATSYNWKVVATGAGVSATAIDSGMTANTMAMIAGLSTLTSYDLYVETDCGGGTTSGYAGPFTFTTMGASQTTISIGAGTSSSSTRGPFQRSDTNSTTVFSRFNHIYTASELAAAGITAGASITQLQWELASSNVIIGSGNANLKIYIKNSSATAATSDTWVNLITGSTLALDKDFNTSDNFPGANGWMPFTFSTPFVYTGGALEIAVDWDCSQVSTPAFSGDGSLKWRWESTAPDNLVVKKTSSSSPSTTISDLKNERANIQLVLSSAMATCDDPIGLSVSNITATSVDLSWMTAGSASSYNWVIVAAGAGSGGTVVDGGMTSDTFATTTALTAVTSYDLYVQSDCGSIGTSNFSGPYNFTTSCSGALTATVTKTVTNVSCNGDADGAIDLTVSGGAPVFTFMWNNGSTTEDLTGLTAGNYSVTITDANGCIGVDTAMVTEPDILAISVSSVSDSSATGVGSATAMVTGGTAPYIYSWDGTVGTADLTGLTNGTYTVSVTDANGCSDTASVTVSDFVSTVNIDYITSLSVAPNPTKGNITIDLELSKSADIQIAVYSITGVLVEDFGYENTAQKKEQIDLSNYSEGLYFIRFMIDNQIVTKKIILTK